ncbi:MAG: radical SAM protein [Candidatus Omnitrophota bacterium]|nr:radical SAM protein [Candidatus Omnitrophota bacterium]
MICGDYAELHNRIIGKNNFEEVIQNVKENLSKKRKIIIGISRYNFFRLNEIVNFCFNLNGKDLNNRKNTIASFDIFPMRDILSNFLLYMDRIKKINGNIEVKLIDRSLREILETVGLNACIHQEKERDIARLLGVICEEAFIGPEVIVIDPFHKCNVKCVHCFVHNPLINHPQEFLDRKFTLEKFKEIVDDSADLKVDNIILQGDGEPLMHPNFLDMIRYIREKKIKALFFTNGSFLNKQIAEEIINLRVEEIYCSLPAGSQESYERICINPQGGKIFNLIVNNMKNLMDLKRELKKSSPRLVMTHVIHKLNYDELIRMAELDAYIGTDATRFYLIRLDANNKHLKLSDEQIEVIKRDLPIAVDILKRANIDFVDNIKFQLSHYENSTGAWSKDIFLEKGCTIGWYFCLIPALGDISMCCHLRTVGYLNKQRFKEIWRSEYYRRTRYQAKFISDHKDIKFLNGMTLYDEHCEHCDNHQGLLHIFNDLEKAGLYKFLK